MTLINSLWSRHANEHSLHRQLADAAPYSTIFVPHGEHKGPFIFDKPITLIGQGRSTVLWTAASPPVLVAAPDVHLQNILIETTTVDTIPLLFHLADCEPNLTQIQPQALRSRLMNQHQLIDLGELFAGSAVTVTFEASAQLPQMKVGLVSPSTLIKIVPIAQRNRHEMRRFRLEIKLPNEEGILLEQINFTNDSNGQQDVYLVKAFVRQPPTNDGVFTLTAGQDPRSVYFDGALELGQEQLFFLSEGTAKKLSAKRYGLILYADDSGRDARALWIPSSEDGVVSFGSERVAGWTRRLLHPDDRILIEGLELRVQYLKQKLNRLNLSSYHLEFGRISDHQASTVTLEITLGNVAGHQPGSLAWTGKIKTLVNWLEPIDHALQVPWGTPVKFSINANAHWIAQMSNAEYAEPSAVVIYSTAGEKEMYFLSARITIEQPDYALKIPDSLTFNKDSAAIYAGEIAGLRAKLSLHNSGRLPATCSLSFQVAWLTAQIASVKLQPGESTIIDIELNEAANSLPPGSISEPRAMHLSFIEANQETIIGVKILAVGSERRVSISMDEFSPEIIRINLDAAAVQPFRFRVINTGSIDGEYRVQAHTPFETLPVDKSTGRLIPNQFSAISIPIKVDQFRAVAPRDKTSLTIKLWGGKPGKLNLLAEETFEVEVSDEYPTVRVSPSLQDVTIIEGRPSDHSENFMIQNIGNGHLHGALISHIPWLVVRDGDSLRIGPNQHTTVRVDLTSAATRLSPGEYAEPNALEVIRTDQRTRLRQSAYVAYKLTVESAKPMIYLLQPFIWFGALAPDANPEETIGPTAIVIGNMGNSDWYGEISHTMPWISVEFHQFVVPANHILRIPVRLSQHAETLPYGMIVEDNAILLCDMETRNTLPPICAKLLRLPPRADIIVTPDHIDLGAHLVEWLPIDVKTTCAIENRGLLAWDISHVEVPEWLKLDYDGTAIAPNSELRVPIAVHDDYEFAAQEYAGRIMFEGTDGQQFDVNVLLEITFSNVNITPKQIFVSSNNMEDIPRPISQSRRVKDTETDILRITNQSRAPLPFIISSRNTQSLRRGVLKLFPGSIYTCEWYQPKLQKNANESAGHYVIQPNEAVQIRITLKPDRTIYGPVLPNLSLQMPNGERVEVGVKKKS